MKQFNVDEAENAIKKLSEGGRLKAQSFSYGRPHDDVGFMDRLNGTFGKTVLAVGAAAAMMVGIGRMGIDDYDNVVINEGSQYSIQYEQTGSLDLTRYVREDVLSQMDLEGLIPGHVEQVQRYSVGVSEDGVVRDVCSDFVENTYQMGVRTDSVTIKSECGLDIADLPVAKIQQAAQAQRDVNRFAEIEKVMAREGEITQQAAEFQTYKVEFDAKYGDIENAVAVIDAAAYDKADQASEAYQAALKEARSEQGEYKTQTTRSTKTTSQPNQSALTSHMWMKANPNAGIRAMGYMRSLKDAAKPHKTQKHVSTSSRRVYDGPSEQELLDSSPHLKDLHTEATEAWQVRSEIQNDIIKYQSLEQGFQTSLKLPEYKAEMETFKATYGSAYDALVSRSQNLKEGARDFANEVQKGAGFVAQGISAVRTNHTPELKR